MFSPTSLITRTTTAITQLFSNKSRLQKYDEIPRDYFKLLTKLPWARRKLLETSIEQDLEGSHYHGMLNTLANHSIGPAPIIIGQTDNPEVNTNLEDRWQRFCQRNEIGNTCRLLRRSAARSGIAIGVPYIREVSSDDVKLGIRVVPTEKLQSPSGSTIEDRIFEGIEYNNNFEPIKFWLDNEQSYELSGSNETPKSILWWKKKDECRIAGVPECAPALCILPSVKRYLDAIIRSAEFRAAIPLAIKLDPLVWGKEVAQQVGMPTNKMEYEPGMIPTLPPGTSLEGIPLSGTVTEDNAVLDAMVGAAARCINMPLNLAMGNSSKFNMASSQVDFGPWKEAIMIDREDFGIVIQQIIDMWMYMGMKIPGYFNNMTKQMIDTDSLDYSISYRAVFHHPDPLKVSNSLYTDLISGATTLTQYHTECGRNPRRIIQREAQLLGKTYEELCTLYLTNRSPAALQVLKLLPEGDSSDNQK
jgi:hypothetical protein